MENELNLSNARILKWFLSPSLHPPDCLWFSVLVRQFCLTAAGALSLGFSCARVSGLRQIRSVNLHCGFGKQDSGGEYSCVCPVPVVAVVQEGVIVPPELGLGTAPHPMAGGSHL